MDDEAGGADGDLARGIVGGRADEGDVLRQAGEERGDGVGVGGAERLPIEQAQELRPGAPGGATVRLRAVAEVGEVAAEHEGIDLLHPKRSWRSGCRRGRGARRRHAVSARRARRRSGGWRRGRCRAGAPARRSSGRRGPATSARRGRGCRSCDRRRRRRCRCERRQPLAAARSCRRWSRTACPGRAHRDPGGRRPHGDRRCCDTPARRVV